jgi:dihydroneopterin aldolase
MSVSEPQLIGMVPDHLRVKSSRILLDQLEVQADIGFHDFEIGKPQRLLITVEIWFNDVAAPSEDDPAAAWDYDYLRTEVQSLAAARRYNLQETLAHAIYQRFAGMHGIKALRVVTTKPDIYREARGVGIEIASIA